MELKCNNYYNDWWPGKKTLYTAQVDGQVINERQVTFTGAHKPGQSNATVKGVRFDDCKMDLIPDGIKDTFPAMTIFLVFTANIKRLTKEDFRQFRGIKELWFSSCDIEYLPGNLFEHLPDLEVISFQTCKIRYIDAEILDHLQHLKVVKFNENTNINCYSDSISMLSGRNGISIEELKENLRDPKLRAPSDYDTYDKMPGGIAADIKSFLQDDKFKDFLVNVEGELFRAHRFMLAARSRVLAQMMTEDGNENDLVLLDIDVKTFEVILKFIYDDVMPDANVSINGFDIFMAANRLGLDKLAAYAIENMKPTITPENALELLINGERYGIEKLKESAIDEIRKMFPDEVLKDELIKDTEKLSQLVTAKRNMDEAIKDAIEEFENMKFFD